MVAWLSHYAQLNPNDETSRKVHRTILVLLLRAKLLRPQDVDVYFATYMDAGRNMVWVELALTFVRQCLVDNIAQTYEFANILETVAKMRPSNTAVRKQLQKWLQDLRTLAAAKEEQKAVASGQVPGQGLAPGPGQGLGLVPSSAAPSAAVGGARDASVRDHVTVSMVHYRPYETHPIYSHIPILSHLPPLTPLSHSPLSLTYSSLAYPPPLNRCCWSVG